MTKKEVLSLVSLALDAYLYVDKRHDCERYELNPEDWDVARKYWHACKYDSQKVLNLVENTFAEGIE